MKSSGCLIAMLIFLFISGLVYFGYEKLFLERYASPPLKAQGNPATLLPILVPDPSAVKIMSATSSQ